MHTLLSFPFTVSTQGLTLDLAPRRAGGLAVGKQSQPRRRSSTQPKKEDAAPVAVPAAEPDNNAAAAADIS